MEQFKKEYLELCLKHGLCIVSCEPLGIGKVRESFALKDIYDDKGEWENCFSIEGEEAFREIVNKLN